MSLTSQIDYLTIGTICHDMTPDGLVAGGTVAYAGRTAHALGCRTAVLTSAAADYDFEKALPGILVRHKVAAETTTFENIYTPEGRLQIIHAVSARLLAQDVPVEWHRAGIVHLGPLVNEVEPDMIQLFSNSLIGLTPQGWLRRWNEDGHVYAREWPDAQRILPLAAAVILSEEDLLDDAMLDHYRRWSRLLVLTLGRRGCIVFMGDEKRQIPAPHVPEVELTGAGDIFAAAFLTRLRQTGGNPWEAALFANDIASQSVTQATIDAKVAHIEAYQAGQLARDST